jgi:hypothetical protein
LVPKYSDILCIPLILSENTIVFDSVSIGLDWQFFEGGQIFQVSGSASGENRPVILPGAGPEGAQRFAVQIKDVTGDH